MTIVSTVSVSILSFQVISFVSLLLTFLVVVLFCISTLPTFDQKQRNVVLYSLETASICWFTIEFLVRIVTSPDKKSFLKTMQAWVDVVAIIPFYLELVFPEEEDLRVLKLLYVLRLYRAFRAFRFSYVLQVFIQTIKGSFRELFLLFFIFLILVVTYGSLAFYAERNENGNFSSIPASFWWSLITMTTVGTMIFELILITNSWRGKTFLGNKQFHLREN